MDRKRVLAEIGQLEEQHELAWDLDEKWVMITDFEYPSGWNPREERLFFSLPHNYPRRYPEVYLPPGMEYKGGSPVHLYPPNDDGWHPWCVEKIPWKPGQHNLKTVAQLIDASLRRPNARNPFKGAGADGIFNIF